MSSCFQVTVRQTTSNDSLATLKRLEGDSEPTDIQDEGVRRQLLVMCRNI